MELPPEVVGYILEMPVSPDTYHTLCLVSHECYLRTRANKDVFIQAISELLDIPIKGERMSRMLHGFSTKSFVPSPEYILQLGAITVSREVTEYNATFCFTFPGLHGWVTCRDYTEHVL